MSDNRCYHPNPCCPSCEPVTAGNANNNVNANTNPYANVNANANPYANANANTNPYANANANTNPYANVNTNANANGNTNVNANINNNNNNNFPPRCHVHEVLGSVMVAEEQNIPSSMAAELNGEQRWPRPDFDEDHNHRFATISGPAIPIPGGHVHEIAVRTDFYDDHFHLIIATSGPAVFVGDRHVHFISGYTSFSDGHSHAYRVATLIDDPTGD